MTSKITHCCEEGCLVHLSTTFQISTSIVAIVARVLFITSDPDQIRKSAVAVRQSCKLLNTITGHAFKRCHPCCHLQPFLSLNVIMLHRTASRKQLVL
jgi:hypothetical protein